MIPALLQVAPALGGLAATDAGRDTKENVRQTVITFSRIVVDASFAVRFWEGLADNEPLA